MKNARILLVEDDPDISRLLGDWLQGLGVHFTWAMDITEADTALAATSFDLIISDVHLPGNHRLGWVEQVLEGAFPPPILLLTGNPELETALKAANLPVAGYLIKPPDFVVLGDLIQHLVSEHRRRAELRALSREAAWLLTTDEAGSPDDPLRSKLLLLSQYLGAEAGRSWRDRPMTDDAAAPWRTAVKDTISVLEKTRHSFRSKELGRLRHHLEKLLEKQAAPEPAAAGTLTGP